MNYLLKCFLILLVNLIFSKSIFADEKIFMCDVDNFVDTSRVFNPEKRDKVFEAKQLNKKYLLTMTEKKFFLTDTNIKNKNSQTTYLIIKRVTNTKDFMSVKVSNIGVGSLVFNTQRKDGTKTFQGSFFTYVYYLKCK